MLYCAMIRRADQDQEGKLIPTERNTSENCKEIKTSTFPFTFQCSPKYSFKFFLYFPNLFLLKFYTDAKNEF